MHPAEMTIRHAEGRDLSALLDIYNHYILHTPITFDIEPRTIEQRRDWFEGFSGTGRYRCLVAILDESPVGWASSHRVKDRAAYDRSVEASIYLSPQVCGRGFGRRLYKALFDLLAHEDVHRIYGGITHPNAASVGLHLAMGFRLIGVQSEVGYKFGKYWDVGLYEKPFH